MDVAAISEESLDHWLTPSYVGRTRVGGVNINQPRMRAVLKAVIALAAAPHGFRCADLAHKVNSTLENYSPRQAAYDLKKLRGKNLVRKIDNSRRYEPLPEGLQNMAALLIVREKILKPVLAGAGKPKRGLKPISIIQTCNSRCVTFFRPSAMQCDLIHKVLSLLAH